MVIKKRGRLTAQREEKKESNKKVLNSVGNPLLCLPTAKEARPENELIRLPDREDETPP